MTKKKNYYAFKNGRSIGIFETRKEWIKSIYKFTNAIYQKFPSKEIAEKWLSTLNLKTELSADKIDESKYEAIVYVNGNFKNNVFTYGIVILLKFQKLTSA